MKNGLSDLSNTLFEIIDRLTDDTGELNLQDEIEKAEAVSEVADKIIEIGKVQVAAMRIMGETRVNKDELPELIAPKRKKYNAIQ